MNRSELAKHPAGRTGMSKAATIEAVDSIFDAIGEALENNEETQILGFGTFRTKNHPARTARNPHTGENLSIPASTVPVFKADKTLKDAVGSAAS